MFENFSNFVRRMGKNKIKLSLLSNESAFAVLFFQKEDADRRWKCVALNSNMQLNPESRQEIIELGLKKIKFYQE